MSKATEANGSAYQASVRRANTSQILALLRSEGPLSRAELATRTVLYRSTVSSIVNELLASGLVRERSVQPERVGRPGVLLEIDPRGGFAIGIEIGLGFVLILLTDLAANVLERRMIALPAAVSQEAFLDQVEHALDEMIAWSAQCGRRVCGIGLAVPGTVDAEEGKLLFAYRLGWRDVPFERLWRERFGLPVFVENDANAAAVGEYYFGVARNIRDLFYLYTNGIGLGSGIFIGGRLLRGSNGFAGEIAHVTLDPQGPLCSCGQRGCWETMIGPEALVQVCRAARGEGGKPSDRPNGRAVSGEEPLSFNQLAKATVAGDTAGRAAVEYLGRTVGLGVANLVRVLNPELVVLGGNFGMLGDLILPIVKQVVWETTFEHPLRVLRIAATSFGADAAALGAASLVLNSILRQPNLANIY